MEKKVIETKTGKTWLSEEGIIYMAFSPNSECTLENAKEIVAAHAKLGKGKKVPGFVDLRNIKSIDREARTYFAGEESAKACIAIALLIGSPLSRMVGNFFMDLNKPIMPTKLFTSEKEAIEWLKEFLERDKKTL